MYIESSKSSISSSDNYYSCTDQPSLTNTIINETDHKFIIKCSKENNINIVNKETKRMSKIFKFSYEWSFDEVIQMLKNLNYKEYPQLYIFIIETENIRICSTKKNKRHKKLENVEKLKKILLGFNKNRPLLLQLTSKDENVTKFYYKDEKSTKFYAIDESQRNFERNLNFSSFFCSFLDGKFEKLADQLRSNLSNVKNTSLIMRLLRTLETDDEDIALLILKIAECGSKKELLSILDAPFCEEGRTLNEESPKYIYLEFSHGSSEDDSSDCQENLDAASNDGSSVTSVLLIVVENKNKEIIDYLITYWSHLIKQLPFQHQVRISEAALETNQMDILCDLLEISDFPFPTVHSRFCEIISTRIKLKNAIEEENFSIIDEIVNNNLNLKFNYCPDNKSALTLAKELKKSKVFFHLKSKGFEGETCEDIYIDLCKTDVTKTLKQAAEQRTINVKESIPNTHSSIMILSAKSKIHNSRIENHQEVEYRQKIIKWFEDIYKISPELLDVAASCEFLKIIFDFETVTVENVSLAQPNASGSTYIVSKWIFIGAKLSDFNRDQAIKGVIAHELCHYVMSLVFENHENPYHKYSMDRKEDFEKIISLIDNWSVTKNKQPDDECFGIISSVFLQYASKDFHPELIVRVIQIMAQLKQYIQKNKDVVKLNEIFGLLSIIQKNQNIEIVNSKVKNEFLDTNLNIISTNSPKLLLNDILKQFLEKYGILLDSQNLFIKPGKLKNERLMNNFNHICFKHSKLNIIFDCSREIPKNLCKSVFKKDHSFTFVITNEKQNAELVKLMQLEALPQNEINYKLEDLTEQSQMIILNTEINFQNNFKCTLNDMLQNLTQTKKIEVRNHENILISCLRDIIDDELFILLVNQEAFSINQEIENLLSEKSFEFLYQTRNLILEEKEDLVSQDEILSLIHNKHYRPVSLRWIILILGLSISWIRGKSK
ncbi:hypothetical protein ACKWTF_001281 [Chironomus riparius]